VPVSVVIASFARPSNLPHALSWLLRLEPIHRERSEILVAHGSLRSLSAASAIDANATAACAQSSSPDRCAPVSARVRHLDTTEHNARHFAAQRFFAAASATNDVLLHLDDECAMTSLDSTCLDLTRPASIEDDLDRSSSLWRL
jgi:hypothetical protein